jgi:hypothetical protein
MVYEERNKTEQCVEWYKTYRKKSDVKSAAYTAPQYERPVKMERKITKYSSFPKYKV